MKNKKLLLLGTFALVFTSGLAAAGTTFAWYQTNRNASLTFSSAQIENLDSHLLVTHLANQSGVTPTVDSKDNALEYVGKYVGINRVTDISGNGVNFYKPYWTSQANKAATVVKVDAEDHFIDLFVKIERWHEYDEDQYLGEQEDFEGFNEPFGLKVYLGAGSEILPVDKNNERDKNAVKASRMAVLQYANEDRTATPKVNILYAPDPDGKYLIEDEDAVGLDDDENPNYDYHEGFKLVEPQEDDSLGSITVPDIKTGVIKTMDTIEDAESDETKHFLVADLMDDKVAYIAFRFWIEGEDAQTNRDATLGSLGGMFKVNLNLYALHETIN